MCIVDSICHVFIGNVIALSKHGPALNHTCQEVIHLMKPCKQMMSCVSNVHVALRAPSPQKGSTLRILKKQETVECVFENCHFKTNIHGTFASLRSRKHTLHSLDDFKAELLHRNVTPVNAGDDPAEDFERGEVYDEEMKELPNLIEANLAHLFLKLQSIFNVPNRCIDEVVEELNFISGTASGPIIKRFYSHAYRSIIVSYMIQ